MKIGDGIHHGGTQKHCIIYRATLAVDCKHKVKLRTETKMNNSMSCFQSSWNLRSIFSLLAAWDSQQNMSTSSEGHVRGK